MNLIEVMKKFEELKTHDLVAAKPAEKRDISRLMIIERKTRKIHHRIFLDILDYLNKNDCIVLNETKVVKARFEVYCETGSKKEVLFCSAVDRNLRVWKCISRKLKRNKRYFIDEETYFTVKDERFDEGYTVEFNREFTFDDMDKKGKVPLPHYIIKKRNEICENDIDDEKYYQTVYASEKGSIAAPTAGFHFTNDILERIRNKGISIARIVLHIGYGTFKMVRSDPDSFVMPAEYAKITPEAALLINSSKERGGRVFVVGTSSMRTVEKMNDGVRVVPGEGYTDIFIKPGWSFKIADSFITNLHLPHSPPLYMTIAFCGDWKLLFDAYYQAKELGYRFYSYGDACLIL